MHITDHVEYLINMGSDPHFGIRLPEGSFLCYSFQGEPHSSFNIISNSQLEMNALFVPDSQRENNTWIGSIGITLYHDGKNTTTLKFTAADKLIHVGSIVELDAMTVRSISFNKGKLSIVESPHEHTPKYPSVRVDFVDSELSFTVAFIKNDHLDLAWHSSGEPYMNSRGVVGKDGSKTTFQTPPAMFRYSTFILQEVFWVCVYRYLMLSSSSTTFTFMQVSSSVME